MVCPRRFASSEREKVSFIDATEAREDKKDKLELISAKKKRTLDNYFASIFCARTRVHLFSYIRGVLSFSKHFSDLSSNRRHLVFQLFLI
jgi:hypothetical protein